jgi:hypothetical protein
MAEFGQSTNPLDSNYHPAGLPLIPGYIEVIHPGDPLASNSENIGEIKLFAWKGHSVINNVDVDEAGAGWILAKDWMPYQRPSFVSPPFAGYLSGHSTYSRAAAELLTDFTGSKYFPGGLGVFHAVQNQFLVFEDGPSTDIDLQWATYQDAADESSLSRIWGGIHPPFDDVKGRKIAVLVAEDAFSKAETYFSNVPGDSLFDVPGCIDPLACNYSSIATFNNGSCTYGPVYYADADGDGYGSAMSDTTACEVPSGYVSNNDDCNDQVGTVNPLANEICTNAVDDNCNAILDEGCTAGMLELKVLLEGYNAGNGLMRPVLFDAGLHANPSACDSITIEWRSVNQPSVPTHAAQALLMHNGFVYTTYPVSLTGDFWLVVRHRNSVEIWSKQAVTVNGSGIFYDYSKP